MKISFIISNFHNNYEDLIPFAFILQSFVMGAKEIKVFFVKNGIQLANIENLSNFKLENKFKENIYAQTGIEISNINTLYDLIIFLIKKFNISFKICNLSVVLSKIHKEKLEFETTTLFDILAEIYSSDKVFFF